MLRPFLVLFFLALASGAAAQSTDRPGDVYETVEVNPVLIGGIAGLQQRIVYPEAARRAGVEGRVFVQFIVDEQGDVQDATCAIIRGEAPNPLLCEAGRAAVLGSQFTPGMQDGRAVKVRFTLPVDFKLRGGTSCLGLF